MDRFKPRSHSEMPSRYSDKTVDGDVVLSLPRSKPRRTKSYPAMFEAYQLTIIECVAAGATNNEIVNALNAANGTTLTANDIKTRLKCIFDQTSQMLGISISDRQQLAEKFKSDPEFFRNKVRAPVVQAGLPDDFDEEADIESPSEPVRT